METDITPIDGDKDTGLEASPASESPLGSQTVEQAQNLDHTSTAATEPETAIDPSTLPPAKQDSADYTSDPNSPENVQSPNNEGSFTPELLADVGNDQYQSDDELSVKYTAQAAEGDVHKDDGNDDDAYDPELSLVDPLTSVRRPSHDDEITVTSLQNAAVDDLSPLSDLENHYVEENQNEEDDYDPETDIQTSETKPANSIPPKPTTSTLPAKPVGLPPKPPVSANLTPALSSGTIEPPGPQDKLKEAFDAIMQSDLVKDPQFITLSQEDQMKLILEQLNKTNVQLGGAPVPDTSKMNYDQVYSYNKPFKMIKDPIPLVPVNEFCRRPNITLPMTAQEERDYEEFIKKETFYMGLQNWDEFPDKSRLFIGNLPANTISKQDLFRIFSQYGELIQISIKAGYGFAQFRNAEACLDCIKGETNVPLHNKIMRLDASRPQKSKKSSRNEQSDVNGSRGRERSPDEGPNKRRKQIPDCQVYTTGKSSVFFIRRVKKAFASARLNTETEDITNKELDDVISEAAYSGVLGVCIVKEMKVDVQTFESTPDGGIKFDEYADVEPEVAADILHKAKVEKYGEQPAVHQNFEDPDANFGRRRGGRDRDRRGGRNSRHSQHASQNWNYIDFGQPQSFDNNTFGNPARRNFASGSSPSLGFAQQSVTGYGQPDPKFQQSYSQTHQQPYPSQLLPQNNQANLIQAIQGLGPQSAQNVLNILQNQSSQSQNTLPYSGQSPGHNFSQVQAGHSQQPHQATNSPHRQVNSLLTQLQSGSNPSYAPQSEAQPGSTQALMETLARLSRK